MLQVSWGLCSRELSHAKRDLTAKKQEAKEAAAEHRRTRWVRGGALQPTLSACLYTLPCLLMCGRIRGCSYRRHHAPSGHSAHLTSCCGAAAVAMLDSSQRDYLLGKLRDIEHKLQASKGVRQATEREKRLASAAATLKKEVPGGAALEDAPSACCIPHLCLHSSDLCGLTSQSCTMGSTQGTAGACCTYAVCSLKLSLFASSVEAWVATLHLPKAVCVLKLSLPFHLRRCMVE